MPATPCVHVGVRRRARLLATGVTAHRYAVLPPSQRQRGSPSRHRNRRSPDLSSALDLVELVVLGDSLVRKGVTTAEDLRAAAAKHRGRGARVARRAAALVRAGVDSPTETRLRLLIVLAGLPEPVVDHRIRDEEGRVVYRIHLSFPELKVAIEYDGRQHIERESQWSSDILRREDLENDGWRFVVAVSQDVYATPEATLRRVLQRSRAAAPGPAPQRRVAPVLSRPLRLMPQECSTRRLLPRPAGVMCVEMLHWTLIAKREGAEARDKGAREGARRRRGRAGARGVRRARRWRSRSRRAARATPRATRPGGHVGNHVSPSGSVVHLGDEHAGGRTAGPRRRPAPPPATNTSSAGPASDRASGSECAASTLGWLPRRLSRVTTMVRRPGRARPIDSNVLRPMTSGWPMVVALKWARSSGRCHGIPPSRPMTPLRPTAAMSVIRVMSRVCRAAQTAIGALIDGCAS